MKSIISIISYLGLIRPENQIKNLILFIPIFFSGELDFQSQRFFDVVKLFVLFIACTSSVYLLNDYFDYENDIVNPRKINRTSSRKKVSRKSLLKISFGFISIYLILFYRFRSIFKKFEPFLPRFIYYLFCFPQTDPIS